MQLSMFYQNSVRTGFVLTGCPHQHSGASATVSMQSFSCTRRMQRDMPRCQNVTVVLFVVERSYAQRFRPVMCIAHVRR